MRISAWSSDVCSSDLRPAVVLWAIVRFSALIVSRPPRGIASRALTTRFRIALSSWVGSVHTGQASSATVISISICSPSVRDSISDMPNIIGPTATRSEEHTSELQSLMRISYAVFCLKKKKRTNQQNDTTQSLQYDHQ